MTKRVKNKKINNTDIPIVILCGGQGTRLHEETSLIPKPLVKIGDYPILWHIMKTYSHYGFKKFILCLGYKGEMIKEYFLHYKIKRKNFSISLKSNEIKIYDQNDIEDWEIILIDTGKTAMTGARVKKVEKYVNSNTFMLTYGDGVADINIDKLLKFHKSHGKIGTITGVLPPSRYGELMAKSNNVINFSEKPQIIPKNDSNLINGGYFIFNKKIFKYLKDSDTCFLEKEPLNNLINDGELMVYRHTYFWQCMDTYREKILLNKLWGTNRPWAVWEK